MGISEVRAPAFWQRWCIVILLILALAGGYMMLYALSPLQTVLETREGWNLMAYSRYSSAESFLNVFCGLLLVAGLLTDRLGTRVAGWLSGILMLAGGFMNYYAFTPFFTSSCVSAWLSSNLNLPDEWWNITPLCAGMVPSAKLAAIGFMLFGVGIEMSGVAASRGTVKWFKGKELATAMGVQLAGSRVMVAVALWASPRLADMGGSSDVSRPLMVALLFLTAGLLCWTAYGVLDRRTGKENHSKETIRSLLTPLRELCRDNRHNRIMWLLCAICVTYYAAVIPFYRYATAIFQLTLGMESAGAASLIAALPLVAALATPLVCMIPDFKGGATWLMAAGCLCIMACYAGFAYVLPSYPRLWVAYTGIALLGLSSAFVSAGLWPLLPRVAPERSLGSAYAAFYWVQAIGLYVTPIMVAYIVGDGNGKDAASYVPAMMLFALLAGGALAATAWLAALNRRWKLGLNMPNRLNTGKATDDSDN